MIRNLHGPKSKSLLSMTECIFSRSNTNVTQGDCKRWQHNCLLSRFSAVVLLFVIAGVPVWPQTPKVTTTLSLSSVHRVYVGDFGNSLEAHGVRQGLEEQIKKSNDFQLANSPSQADAVLTGNSEIYIRGYFSLYARAGTSPANGKPLYGGYVSVVLKNQSGETLWSYLSTLKWASKDPSHDIATDVARHLIAAQSGSARSKP